MDENLVLHDLINQLASDSITEMINDSSSNFKILDYFSILLNLKNRYTGNILTYDLKSFHLF